ncbi:hypothetical protein CABS01_16949 [Colletotrichum abscissum]|nr:uncharacterized protein CABS01_16949 [Colletotrichum abscissum]KAK1503119.1 hypothetical protein CABS01_16949 [Colletotrichum abscissum]
MLTSGDCLAMIQCVSVICLVNCESLAMIQVADTFPC